MLRFFPAESGKQVRLAKVDEVVNDIGDPDIAVLEGHTDTLTDDKTMSLKCASEMLSNCNITVASSRYQRKSSLYSHQNLARTSKRKVSTSTPLSYSNPARLGNTAVMVHLVADSIVCRFKDW